MLLGSAEFYENLTVLNVRNKEKKLQLNKNQNLKIKYQNNDRGNVRNGRCKNIIMYHYIHDVL